MGVKKPSTIPACNSKGQICRVLRPAARYRCRWHDDLACTGQVRLGLLHRLTVHDPVDGDVFSHDIVLGQLFRQQLALNRHQVGVQASFECFQIRHGVGPLLTMLTQKLGQLAQRRAFQKRRFLICFHWAVTSYQLSSLSRPNYEQVTAFCQDEITI